jgi:hypothetical protein
LTPRQITAYLFLAERRKERELHSQLAVASLAASGDGKAIKNQLEKWEKEA